MIGELSLHVFGPKGLSSSLSPNAQLFVYPIGYKCGLEHAIAAKLLAGRKCAITRPGVRVAERSEPAGLFRLAFIALFGIPCLMGEAGHERFR